MMTPPTSPLRVGVIASGGGTNLQAILDRISAGDLDAEVVIVISNNRNAGALKRAREAHVEAVHCSETSSGSSERFVRELIGHLQHARVELVVLAGYMKLVPEDVVNEFADRMINIHPALLPKFGGKGYYGMRVHEAVIDAQESESGATVHFVDNRYDHGPILLQRKVPVFPDDTPEGLRGRVLEAEHQLLPDAIARFAHSYRRRMDTG